MQNKITLLTIGVVLLVLALDYFGDFGIIQRIMKNSGITRIIAGILIFVGTCAFGKEQPHRSFMHSILALIILNFSLGLIFPKIIPYFTIGFLSHLFIDSLNYKKVQIWYPLKRSVRFKLCHANGIVNTVLFIVGFIVSVFEIVSLTFHSIV